jgi:uncharacterized phage-associated protein
MTPFETAKKQAEQLSIDEVANFRRWLAAFETALWDREMSAELEALWRETRAQAKPDA